jgi:hypothetical protein
MYAPFALLKVAQTHNKHVTSATHAAHTRDAQTRALATSVRRICGVKLGTASRDFLLEKGSALSTRMLKQITNLRRLGMESRVFLDGRLVIRLVDHVHPT